MSTIGSYPRFDDSQSQDKGEVKKENASKVKNGMTTESKKQLLSQMDERLKSKTDEIGQKVLSSQEKTELSETEHKETKNESLPKVKFQLSEKIDNFITKSIVEKYDFDPQHAVFQEMTPEKKVVVFAQMKYDFRGVGIEEIIPEDELLGIKERIEKEMVAANDIALLAEVTRGMSPLETNLMKDSIKQALNIFINTAFDSKDPRRAEYGKLPIEEQLAKLGKTLEDVKMISKNLRAEVSDSELSQATKKFKDANQMKAAVKSKVDDLIVEKYGRDNSEVNKLSLSGKVLLLGTTLDDIIKDYKDELPLFTTQETIKLEIEKTNRKLEGPGATIPEIIVLDKELKMDKTALESSKVGEKKLKKTKQEWGEYKEITRGKAKVVWLGKSATEAFYTPVPNIFNSKEKEIRAEVETTSKIKQNLQNLGGDTSNLALTMDIVKGEGKIAGKYTIRTDKAIGDLEKGVRDKKLTFQQSIKISQEIVKGMSNLQKAGFVSGDPKLENVLLYENPNTKEISAKISDFGKSTEVRGDDHRMYTGNSRFAPPEMTLSKQGEVYSTAIMVIRVLEGALLDNENDRMLIQPKNIDLTVRDKKREGIERFLMMNKDCPQTEASSLHAKIKVYGRGAMLKVGIPLNEDLKTAELEVHRYINALKDKLVEKHPENSASIGVLCRLLREMTKSDPKDRPTLALSEELYSALDFV